MKFLCSYGGKILPRFSDGKLRYHGGHTRVLSVNRSISFTELMTKLGEMCGGKVSLRCQLPTEDLDALVSVTSDEDLLNLIEEYDRAATQSPTLNLKIRAFLSPLKSVKKVSSPPLTTGAVASSSSSNSSSSSVSSSGSVSKPPIPKPLPRPITDNNNCYRQISSQSIPLRKAPSHQYHPQCYTSNSGPPTHIYLVNNSNYWQ